MLLPSAQAASNACSEPECEGVRKLIPDAAGPLDTERVVRASRLAGAAEAILDGVGRRSEPSTRKEYEENIDLIRSHSSEPAFAIAWAEGRGMSLEGAIRYALQSEVQV